MKDGVAAKQYVELELLNKQLQELERTIQLTDQEIEHGILATRMLDELEHASSETEILIPLGSGAFATVKAGDVKNVKMLVGAGVLVDREAKDASEGLLKQIEELKNHRAHSLNLHDQLIDKIVELQRTIESELETKR